MNIQEKEQIEIQFWKNSLTENPESDSVDNLISKFCEARILQEKIEYHKKLFENSTSILEIGAGQCWASSLIKRRFPDKTVIASDISEYAIQSAKKWEYVFQSSLDQKLICRSYEIPLENESIDLIFCFESAHHFIKHRKTLTEIHRVLKKGGTCLYLHEPSCRQYLYKLAYARANWIRPDVPEDILVYSKIQTIAEQIGFEVDLRFDPNTLNRRPLETIYYFAMQKLPFLSSYLLCSTDFIFTKK
jgi:ubiquinone/menaquinone biosynthesis C-methylase UbiE